MGDLPPSTRVPDQTEEGFVLDERTLRDRIADLRHVVRVTDQMLRGIEHARARLTGKDRQRIERQRRMLTRARDEATLELEHLEGSLP